MLTNDDNRAEMLPNDDEDVRMMMMKIIATGNYGMVTMDQSLYHTQYLIWPS